METYEQQTFLDSDPLLYSAQEYRASRQVWPGSDAARQMTVGSGIQCSTWLDQSSLLGRFSRILLESSAWTHSGQFLYAWWNLDTKFEVSMFRLTQLAPNTSDTELSLWPTPNAGNFNDGESLETWEERRQKNKAKGINGNGQGTPLAIAAKLWPMPTAQEAKHAAGTAESCQNVPVNGLLGRAVHQMDELPSGSLNPRFVCQLMGFPEDWTELKEK